MERAGHSSKYRKKFFFDLKNCGSNEDFRNIILYEVLKRTYESLHVIEVSRALMPYQPQFHEKCHTLFL